MFFQDKSALFPYISKRRPYGRTDPRDVEREDGEKAAALPDPEASLAEGHADEEERSRAEQAEEDVADRSGSSASSAAENPQEIVQQPREQPAQRGGRDGYRLRADRHAHRYPNSFFHRPEAAARSS